MVYIIFDRQVLVATHRCVEIGQPVLPKTTFQDFTVYGHDDHIGHATCSSFYTNFDSAFPRMLHVKFDFDFDCLYSHRS